MPVIETEPVVIPTSAPEQESKPPINLKFDPFGPDRDCGDFSSWNVANDFFKAAGGPDSDPHRLDGDNGCTVVFPFDPGLLLAGATESAP